jgi:aminomuconate-semialdehyde/2-hydroxymuconate-6-semialdehyde dehydrogenase
MPADVDHAVSAAKSAFPGWSRMSRSKRSAIMMRVADLIEARLDGTFRPCWLTLAEFAEAESKDQGKTFKMAKALDIPRAVDNFRYFARKILFLEEMTAESDTSRSYVQRVPVGVAGLISPWNLYGGYFNHDDDRPLYLLTWKIAPAIAG